VIIALVVVTVTLLTTVAKQPDVKLLQARKLMLLAVDATIKATKR
jgi:hypothetical protein